MLNKKSRIIYALSLFVFFAIAVGYAYHLTKPISKLPYFGATAESGKHHKILPFKLTDQRGLIITNDSLKGKIYVADFFFTTCKTICPEMTTQMHRAYKIFLNDPSVSFVSHTVDPEFDTREVLAAYAERLNAQSGKWYFLTGDKKEIYDLARTAYFVSDTKGDGGSEDFVHTQNFALVDKQQHIRGYYDGTDSLQINKLISDVEKLKRAE